MSKLRVGIFSLSSCEGCLVQVLNLEDQILDILSRLVVADCRILGVKDRGGRLDVAIVEGSVMSDREREKLREIRERSDVLVAFGDCACYGGKFIVKDFGVDEIKMFLPRGVKSFRSDPLDKYVAVDYYVYGCPVAKDDVLELFRSILVGKEYRPKTYNICAECILRENACLLDKGMLCLGPITRGGCQAVCPTAGRGCFGCRGLAEDANIESLIDIFREKGIEIPDYLWKIKVATGVRK